MIKVGFLTFFIILLLQVNFCFGHQAEFPATRMNDFLGMMGNNYLELINEKLENFVDDTEIPITIQLSHKGNIYKKSSDAYNKAWREHQEKWVQIKVMVDPDSYAHQNTIIKVSDNLSSKLPPDTCKSIIDEVMVAAFTESDFVTNNDYYAGLKAGVELIKGLLVVPENSKLLSVEEILNQTHDATIIGTKYSGNRTSPTCNICVRAALYLLKIDSVLFPITGSGFNDPLNGYELREIKGYVSPPGSAKEIKKNLDKISINVEFKKRFIEIKKRDTEDWKDYFKRLQNKADKGEIVIGVMLNSTGSSGHVMMITPGGLINIEPEDPTVFTPKWGKSFTSRGIVKLPRVLECGPGARESEAPLCRNVDRRGALQRLKWFKYKK